jgi:hypothetical protein
MKTVEDIFNASMALMDELDADGSAQTTDTEEYVNRTPGIINMMVSEYRILAGTSGTFIAVEGLDDLVLNIPDNYALGVMYYGLAANLLVDENPTAASFYEQRYEELRNLYFSRQQSDGDEEITDLYGGIEYGEFSRW